MNFNKKTLLLSALMGWFSGIFAQENASVAVQVNLDVKHILGEVSTFEREKYITVHADVTEREWDGENFTLDLRDHFLNGYDVYLGRNTGGITWYLNAKTSEDPDRPGFANPVDVTANGQTIRNGYASNTQWHAYENRNDLILCAQLHPFWPDGKEVQKGWAFSTTDTSDEPFGTATGEYMGRFLNESFGEGGTTGQPKPTLVEVINEPLWHLTDYGETEPEQVFRFHSAVAKEIKKINPEAQVGGFCTAFPDLEKRNFARWEERWKLFMDIAGEDMDFWTIHLYDFPSINNGKQLYRKGSQMEATFDMMEQYSYLSFGEVKPFMISEYGAQMHDYNKVWSPYRDWLHVKSCNSMIMQFMERTNIINKTINFLPIKAEWGKNGDVVYNHRLMRRANEPESYTGEWVYTDMVKMFELWKDVKGTRADSKSSSLDILTDAFVDGNKAYIIVNNLGFEPTDVAFDFRNEGNVLESIKLKHLYLKNNVPVVELMNFATLPNSLELGAEGTFVLELNYASSIAMTNTSEEVKHYASSYYKPIIANAKEEFTISGVNKGEFGEATLRLGIGREHGKSLQPSVFFNGTKIDVPTDYRGDDQADRPSWFGVIEIDVPYSLLQETNTITVEFNDDGGFISSVAMQTYQFSRKIDRGEAKVELPTSIEKDGFMGYNVFPNPATDILQIAFPYEVQKAQIALYSLDGKKIWEETTNGKQHSIETASFSKGEYIVKINADEREINRIVILQ